MIDDDEFKKESDISDDKESDISDDKESDISDWKVTEWFSDSDDNEEDSKNEIDDVMQEDLLNEGGVNVNNGVIQNDEDNEVIELSDEDKGQVFEWITKKEKLLQLESIRKLLKSDCGCQKKCYEKFSVDEIRKARLMYFNKVTEKRRSELIEILLTQHQESVGEHRSKYSCRGHHICCHAFCSIFGFSENKLRGVQQGLVRRAIPRRIFLATARLEVIGWINYWIEHFCDTPLQPLSVDKDSASHLVTAHSDDKYKSPFRPTRNELYGNFVLDWEKKKPGIDPPDQTYFNKLWKQYGKPLVQFPTRKAHHVCPVCQRYWKARLVNWNDKKQKEYDDHLQHVRHQFGDYMKNVWAAIANPSQISVICLDETTSVGLPRPASNMWIDVSAFKNKKINIKLLPFSP